MASPVLSLASVNNVNANGPSQATLSAVGNAAAMSAHHGVTVVRPIGAGITGVQASSSGAVQVVSMTAPNVSAPTVIANAQPQKIMGPRIQTAPALRIQPAIAPRPNVIQMAGQSQLPPGFTIPPGTILVKTETGQLQLIHTGANQAFITPGRGVAGATQYRFAQAVAPNAVAPSPVAASQPSNGTVGSAITMSATGSGVTRTATPSVVQPQNAASASNMASNSQIPTVATAQIRPVTGGVVTTVSSPVAASSAPGAMPPPALPPGATFVAQPLSAVANSANNNAAAQNNAMENVKKCKNFLSTLIKLAGSQPAETIRNVKDLIQGLIDGKIQPEKFTEQLQIELKSSPQPYLVPFLKKSLPLLRQSLASGIMSIDGVRAPPAGSITAIVNVSSSAASTPAAASSSAVSTPTSSISGVAVVPNQLAGVASGQHPLILSQRVITSSAATAGFRPTIIATGTPGAPTFALATPGQPVLQHSMPGTQLIRTPGGTIVTGIGGIRPGATMMAAVSQPQSQPQPQPQSTSVATVVVTTAAATTTVVSAVTRPVAVTAAASAATVGGPRIIHVPNTCAMTTKASTPVPAPVVSAPSSTPQAPPGATVIPNPAMMSGGPRLIQVSTAAHRNQSRSSSSRDTSASKTTTTATPTPAPYVHRKEKHSASAAFKEDDDINDVAAMGGVNLNEENARILASQADLIGTRIRSTKEIESYSDSPDLVSATPLLKRIHDLAKESGVDEVAPDVSSVIAYAVQQRLKNLLERLNLIAEHRMEVLRSDGRFEVTTDVKSQLKFLSDLDRLEKERQDEQERERLLKAAKSRSKMEDPEQLSLKQKAKELQLKEAEHRRQIEANETALAAIGPRKKKAKLGDEVGGTSSTTAFEIEASGSDATAASSSSLRPRIKRVNLRDLLFLLEQEKETSKTNFLYRTFLK